MSAAKTIGRLFRGLGVLAMIGGIVALGLLLAAGPVGWATIGILAGVTFGGMALSFIGKAISSIANDSQSSSKKDDKPEKKASSKSESKNTKGNKKAATKSAKLENSEKLDKGSIKAEGKAAEAAKTKASIKQKTGFDVDATKAYSKSERKQIAKEMNMGRSQKKQFKKTQDQIRANKLRQFKASRRAELQKAKNGYLPRRDQTLNKAERKQLAKELGVSKKEFLKMEKQIKAQYKENLLTRMKKSRNYIRDTKDRPYDPVKDKPYTKEELKQISEDFGLNRKQRKALNKANQELTKACKHKVLNRHNDLHQNNVKGKTFDYERDRPLSAAEQKQIADDLNLGKKDRKRLAKSEQGMRVQFAQKYMQHRINVCNAVQSGQLDPNSNTAKPLTDKELKAMGWTKAERNALKKQEKKLQKVRAARFIQGQQQTSNNMPQSQSPSVPLTGQSRYQSSAPRNDYPTTWPGGPAANHAGDPQQRHYQQSTPPALSAPEQQQMGQWQQSQQNPQPSYYDMHSHAVGPVMDGYANGQVQPSRALQQQSGMIPPPQQMNDPMMPQQTTARYG